MIKPWRGLWPLLWAGLIGCQPAPPMESPREQGRGKAVEPGIPLQFPRDHGPHEAQGIEWWYLTANLEDAEGNYHAIQWTLFRFLGDTPDGDWWQGQWYMGHLMHESDTGHRAWERWGRGGTGQAGVEAEPFQAWIDDWVLMSPGEAFQPLHLVAGEDNFRLALVAKGSPLVPHGEAGFSRKSADGSLASYYYSLPALGVQGHLHTDAGWQAVSGQAWLDREWSSRFLDQRYGGWDWLSAHLDSGEKMMLFCLRPAPGQDEALRHCEGSRIDTRGSRDPIHPEQIQWRATDWSRLDDGEYPVAWDLELQPEGRRFSIRTRRDDQRNQLTFPYWEGPVLIQGDSPGDNGQGFIEMTGYGH